MSFTEVRSDNKNALLAKKQLLLDNINICEKRIEEVRRNRIQAYIDDDDSSDSDCGLPTPPRSEPTAAHLSSLCSQLSTCLQATQELTGLQVLESEMNVLVDPPVLEHGPPPAEDGLWREVMAECRVDLVPFTITFYVYKPPGAFSALSYHGLRCAALRGAHARELAACGVLAGAKTPSDAVQIMSSYAHAHRSRRSTLARLSERYEARLHMEAKPEGGYLLRCAGVLEVSWYLHNKGSPIAPFHHRMKFNLEYMDESLIALIRSAYRQLLEPSLPTSERTALLADIIDTCREARADVSAGESDAVKTTLEQEPEMLQLKRIPKEKLSELPQQKLIDSEVMAPPKQVPKKLKPKAKENVVKSQPNDQVNKKTAVKSQQNDQVNKKTAVKSQQNDNGNKKTAAKSQQNDKIKGSKNSAVKSQQNVNVNQKTAVKSHQNGNDIKKPAVKRPLPTEEAKTKDVGDKQKDDDPAPKQKKLNKNADHKTETDKLNNVGKGSEKLSAKRPVTKEGRDKNGNEVAKKTKSVTENEVSKKKLNKNADQKTETYKSNNVAKQTEKTSATRPLTKEEGDKNANEVANKTKSVTEKEGSKKKVIKTVGNAKNDENEGNGKVETKKVDKDAKKDKALPTQIEPLISGNLANRKNSDKIQDIHEKPKAQDIAKNVPQKAKHITNRKGDDNVKINVKVQKTRDIAIKSGQVGTAASNATNSNQTPVVSKIPIRKGS